MNTIKFLNFINQPYEENNNAYSSIKFFPISQENRNKENINENEENKMKLAEKNLIIKINDMKTTNSVSQSTMNSEYGNLAKMEKTPAGISNVKEFEKFIEKKFYNRAQNFITNVHLYNFNLSNLPCLKNNHDSQGDYNMSATRSNSTNSFTGKIIINKIVTDISDDSFNQNCSIISNYNNSKKNFKHKANKLNKKNERKVKKTFLDSLHKTKNKKKNKIARTLELLNDSIINDSPKLKDINSEILSTNLLVDEQIYTDYLIKIENCRAHGFMKKHFPIMYSHKNLQLHLKNKNEKCKSMLGITHNNENKNYSNSELPNKIWAPLTDPEIEKKLEEFLEKFKTPLDSSGVSLEKILEYLYKYNFNFNKCYLKLEENRLENLEKDENNTLCLSPCIRNIRKVNNYSCRNKFV